MSTRKNTAPAERTVEQRIAIATAPGWRPRPGTLLVGIPRAIDRRESEWGMYPCVTLDTGEGLVAVHAFHSTLKDGLADLFTKGQLKVDGDPISVYYDGRRVTNATRDLPENKQQHYELYVVMAGDSTTPVTTVEPEADWFAAPAAATA